MALYLTRQSVKAMSRTADPTAKISLLRAAEQVFAEKGLAAAKVEEITRHAGLSKGAFYLHFESKEEAFKQVVESFLARCGANILPPSKLDLAADPATLLAQWLEMDINIFEFLWQNRDILRMLESCQNDLAYLVEAFREAVRATTQEWIHFCKVRGLFRPEVDEDLHSTLICGAYHELSRRMLGESKRPPLEQWVATAQICFARALGSPALISALSGNSSVSQTVESGAFAARRARAE